ncbi:MAG: hypothetical protein ETSY1_24555 [Candidatus Entotheonella factor]|uniref:Band 7 domain-containing protein n=2 Tax=Candidatus Entotheonella TaxID=93171 RepID=W4LGX7_ENTF1|nr:MAG: hypothetical protein ETSY1_24555 [Candidatus Entotheonella factor]
MNHEEQPVPAPNKLPFMQQRQWITLAVVGGIILISFILGGQLFETVRKGTYQIKQAAVTGTMSAKMTPGLWLQFFGDIQTWPKAETFYFTADRDEGEARDQSIEVRFNDGSLCHISGTTRIMMPTNEQDAVNLAVQEGYRSYQDLEQKLILPVIRNALRLTANLMSARESYSDNRADFIFWAWDQVQNGLYETIEETRKVKDLVSGEMVTKTFKIIKRGSDGNPVYQRNPLNGLGIRLANFEIKEFRYADKVKQQIAAQQEALMAVATARANAQRAEQEALTKEAQGKAKVMEAKYEKEQDKIRAVVEATKEKEVAITQAQKELEVARLQKEAAELQKAREIVLGEGEATRKRLVMEADGALAQKLDTYEAVMQRFAAEFAKQKWVPEVVIGSGGGGYGNGPGRNEAANLIHLLTAQALQDLGLDLKIPSRNGSK